MFKYLAIFIQNIILNELWTDYKMHYRSFDTTPLHKQWFMLKQTFGYVHVYCYGVGLPGGVSCVNFEYPTIQFIERHIGFVRKPWSKPRSRRKIQDIRFINSRRNVVFLSFQQTTNRGIETEDSIVSSKPHTHSM